MYLDNQDIQNAHIFPGDNKRFTFKLHHLVYSNCSFILSNSHPISGLHTKIAKNDPITPKTTGHTVGASNHPIIQNITPKQVQSHNMFSSHCQINQSSGNNQKALKDA